MELRVIWRGALSGFLTGLVAFVFSKVFLEPQIDRAIDFEGAHEEAVLRAQGIVPGPEEAAEFSRHTQSTWGLLTGIVGFATAMGVLVAVVYLVVHGRFQVRARTLALLVAGFGFLGVFALPFVKYPGSPPATSNDDTITTRGQLYLGMVGLSLALLVLAAYAGWRLRGRLGVFGATLAAGAGFLVLYAVALALFPALGDLQANKDLIGTLGQVGSSTETPQPVVDGTGTIVFPGFSADVLWKFRFYSVINQLIVWSGIGLVFALLVEQVVGPLRPQPRATREPVAV